MFVLTFWHGIYFLSITVHTHVPTQEQPVERKMRKMCQVEIEVPNRIKARWVKLHKLKQGQRCRYDMCATLKTSNISAEEFKKCWFSLQRRLSNDELFSLFKDSGFSPSHGDINNGRSAFVRKVLKQCKDTKVFLRVCPFVSVRIVYACSHALNDTSTYI